MELPATVKDRLEAAGISLEDVAQGVAAGELSFPLGRFMPEPVGTSETYESLAATLGCSSEFLRRLSGELGLPPAAGDGVRAEDAEMLSLVVTKLDLASEDELSRFARLYGGTTQRLVAAGLLFFDRAVRQRVATFDLSSEQKDDLVYQSSPKFFNLSEHYARWRDHRVDPELAGATLDALRAARR